MVWFKTFISVSQSGLEGKGNASAGSSCGRGAVTFVLAAPLALPPSSHAASAAVRASLPSSAVSNAAEGLELVAEALDDVARWPSELPLLDASTVIQEKGWAAAAC